MSSIEYETLEKIANQTLEGPPSLQRGPLCLCRVCTPL